MARRVFRTKEIEEPTVNLTPLIDVVFVVLIMFIVVAPLLEMDVVKLADASPYSNDVAAIQEKSPVAIHVRKDNSIWFQGERVTVDRLLARLKSARSHYPNIRPQLFHDKEAQFGTYQSVKNAVEAAGWREMDVILKPS